MKEDFSELIQYLDEKFTKIDIKLADTEQRLIRLDEKKADKEDINSLMMAVDKYAKKADAYFQEMVMLAHKVDRHEKWLHQVAEKLGVKLEY